MTILEVVKALPIADRITLIEEVWDTIEDTDIPGPSAAEIDSPNSVWLISSKTPKMLLLLRL